MTDFCDDSGLMPVRVKIKGVPTDANVDFYDAFEFMLARNKATQENERVPFTALRTWAVEYFKGDESDWTTVAAKKFWDMVGGAVKDAGKDEPDSITPS
jgi:hypothetical protein